jgi:hypothetical protein
MSQQWRGDFLSLSQIFKPLSGAASRFSTHRDFPDLDALNALAASRGLATALGLPLVFVRAQAKPRGAARRRRLKDNCNYEDRIHQRGEVSTRRSSWHDFFNAMVWATFPSAKAALNARQISGREPGVVRTREQDRLTMFDEGGVVSLDCRPDRTSSISQINDGSSPRRLYLSFGHALYESVMIGPEPIHALELPLTGITLAATEITSTAALARVDAAIARAVQDGVFKDNDFNRVPLAKLIS